MALGTERVAAVVIGRNEGESLRLSLLSVIATKLPCVYVDSGSSDGSPAVADKLGVPVVELAATRPFSAARARNDGVKEVRRRWPRIRYVIFLDGDCELERNFPSAASSTFDNHPDCAIVTGHLSERHPEASIYNRLCAVEWRGPPGKIENFAALGGIMAARLSALAEVGGFNEQVIAGEDSELGVRMALHSHQVVKLDVAMATHDARMFSFYAWWTRSVRAGHAIAQRYALNGASRVRDCRRELLSAILWGFLVPTLAIALLWPTKGASLLLLGGYVLLGFRIYRHYRGTGLDNADAFLVTRFNLYAKFANVIGIFRYVVNRFRGHFQIIEYK